MAKFRTLVLVGFLLAVFVLMLLAAAKDAKEYTRGCVRTETLVSYQALANARGDVGSYSYTTAKGEIFNSAEQFPLNQPVCVQMGDVEVISQ